MSYELSLDPEAIDFLSKLPKELAQRIWNKLSQGKENPQHYFIRLAEREEYKLRVGDYRIIVEIDTELKRINVLLIGHRKNVYDQI